MARSRSVTIYGLAPGLQSRRPYAGRLRGPGLAAASPGPPTGLQRSHHVTAVPQRIYQCSNCGNRSSSSCLAASSRGQPPYPAGLRDLLKDIAECGPAVSEALPGRAPTRIRFTARNRISGALVLYGFEREVISAHVIRSCLGMPLSITDEAEMPGMRL